VTKAAFEPTLDYCVVKIPRWPFDKFPLGDARLSSQMKSTGEVMAIGRTFSQALLKRCAAPTPGATSLTGWTFARWSDDELDDVCRHRTHERLFVVAEALRRGRSVERCTLEHHRSVLALEILEMSRPKNSCASTRRPMRSSPQNAGFAEPQSPDCPERRGKTVRDLLPESAADVYKMVDTAAAEFPARSPYYYASVGEEEELRAPCRQQWSSSAVADPHRSRVSSSTIRACTGTSAERLPASNR